VKAITIRPPWSAIIAETAALTALGVEPKTVENRGRSIGEQHIGTDIAIHAGQTWCEVGAEDERVTWAWWMFCNSIHPRQANPKLAAIGDTRTGVVGGLRPGLWLDTGAVVAVATLVDCHEATTTGRLFGSEPCCPPWGEATHNGKPAFHLVLGNVRRLQRAVSARGSLAVPWTLPADVEAAVREQLAQAVA
jgi:hypothetical protein